MGKNWHRKYTKHHLRRSYYRGKRDTWRKAIFLFVVFFIAYLVWESWDKIEPEFKPKFEEISNEVKGFGRNVGEIFEIDPERKEECQEALDYINQLRQENNRLYLEWDDRLYNLAVAMSKDMYERNYFDHVTPEGKCVKDFKADYGLSEYTIADNVGGQYEGYSESSMSYSLTINPLDQVDNWMDSRGHRYNLMYPDHIKGAIGCYYGVCVFLGANKDPYGLGWGPCTTGDEGLEYWKTTGKQPGET